jgi:hypothetical protein
MEEDEDEQRWREQVGWLRCAPLREQVWVFVCVLFFWHCRKREEVLRKEGRGMRGVVRGLFCWRGHCRD